MGKRKRKSKSYATTLLGAASKWMASSLRRLAPLLLVASVLWITFVGIRRYLHADPYFVLQEIRIESNGVLSDDAIRGLVDVQTGEHLLQIDLARASRRLRAQPLVKHAALVRHLPSTLIVRVEGREPFMWLDASGHNRRYLLDKEGVVIPAAAGATASGRGDAAVPILARSARIGGEPKARPLTQTTLMGIQALPVIKDTTTERAYLDIGIPYAPARFQLIAWLVKTVGEMRTLPDRGIREIWVDHLEQVTIQLASGITIRLGTDAKHTLHKLDDNPSLLEPETWRTLSVIDLRFNDVTVER